VGVFGRFATQFTRDDLFMRAVIAVSAAWVGGLLFVVARLAFADNLPIWGFLLIGAIAIVGAAYVMLLVAGVFSPAGSWARVKAERWTPDGVGEEGILLLVVVAIPAALITLLLRQIGVQGDRA
jgi:hypothetical protein